MPVAEVANADTVIVLSRIVELVDGVHFGEWGEAADR